MSEGTPAAKQAIGIYGGSFDPVHLGHLRTALEIHQLIGLDEVRFMPSLQPPHRRAPRADSALRLRMLEAAVAGLDGFCVDRRELERGGVSYTIDTLVSLREEFPQASLVLILGMDAWLGLESWHRADELPGYANFVVAHRPGWQPPAPTGWLAEHHVRAPEALKHGAGKVFLHPVTALDISSSAIRELIGAGGDPRFLVPQTVWEILQQTGCYAEQRRGTKLA